MDGRWYLVDLPGYGFARASHTERAAFRKLVDAYVATRPRLAGAVWLLDIRRDPSPDDLNMAALFDSRGVPVLAALTKVDKLNRGQRNPRITAILAAVGLPEDQAVVTSALSGEGIDDLRDSITALVSR